MRVKNIRVFIIIGFFTYFASGLDAALSADEFQMNIETPVFEELKNLIMSGVHQDELVAALQKNDQVETYITAESIILIGLAFSMYLCFKILDGCLRPPHDV